MQLQDELVGIVDRVIFHNQENGFTVFIIKQKNQDVTVKGHAPSIHPGEQVTIKGSWVMHPKFGKQFEATHCMTSLPTSIIGITKYLSSGMIKGIGPVYAEKLVKAFGQNVLEVIDKSPYRLHEVDGIGPKRVERIITAWEDQKEISNVMVFLQEKNISPSYATKIYKKYGQQSIAVLQENPYKLADDIWGIGFKIADQIAQNMGFAHDSIKRITSGILYTLTTIMGLGNVYGELSELKEKALALLELEKSEDNQHKLKLALHDLYNAEKIKLITQEEKHLVTLTQYYFSEKGIAQKIETLLKYPSRYSFDIDAIYNQLRLASEAIVLNDEQQHGIITALQQKITVITGGPGTGKTTLIKKLLAILDAHRVNYKLAAPTGRAAKRINEGTGKSATTIHRLLDFDPSTMGFNYNEQRALPIDFLIIDEASMIDIFLAYSVLKAVPLDAHIIFIGDVDQLPSVGSGNFLHDIIASNKVACIKLITIFRQAQDSLIIVNAHRINNGEFPTTYLPDARKDFYFIKETNPESVYAHLEKIYKTILPEAAIPWYESIVLVPMNRGSVGTIKLNHDLQKILNTASGEKHVASRGSLFKIGDRVMQIRNNYDKFVFNGDIGTIEDINTVDETIIVNFLNYIVEYEFNELDELVHAYAVSIHKSQGSEYSAVIVPIFMQHFTLLQRNLMYTAITRAKKLCIFIGEPRAIGMAIKNNKGSQRLTLLKEFLTSDLQCR